MINSLTPFITDNICQSNMSTHCTQKDNRLRPACSFSMTIILNMCEDGSLAQALKGLGSFLIISLISILCFGMMLIKTMYLAVAKMGEVMVVGPSAYKLVIRP